jgi:type IV secretion system protein VirB6
MIAQSLRAQAPAVLAGTALALLPARAMAQDQAVGSFLFNAINSRLQSAALSISARYVDTVTPIVGIGLTIYVMVMGIGVMQGRVAHPIQELAWRLFKVALILSFLVGAGAYGDRVAGTIIGARDWLASVADPSMNSGLLATLDTLSDTLDSRGSQHAAQVTMFGSYLAHLAASIIFWVAKIVLLVLALFPLLIATAHLYLSIAVGPLAIACLLFPITSKYFDTWLGAILVSVMTNVAVAVILGFALSIFQQMANRPFSVDSANPVSFALDILIVVILLGYTAWKASDLAAQWVGGASAGNPLGLMANQALGSALRSRVSNSVRGKQGS